MRKEIKYYTMYRKEPFDSEEDCLQFENKMKGLERKKFDSLCLRKDLEKYCEYRLDTNDYDVLFPAYRLCQFFNVAPRDLAEELHKRKFEGHWYTIHNTEEYVLYYRVIQDVITTMEELLAENLLPNKYPLTKFCGTYKNGALPDCVIVEDFEILQDAEKIVAGLTPKTK